MVTKKFCSFKKQGAKRSLFSAILFESKPIKSNLSVWFGLTIKQNAEKMKVGKIDLFDRELKKFFERLQASDKKVF